VSDIGVEELARRRSAGEGLMIVDVREQWEVEIASIPGATHIPMARVVADPAAVPRDREVVVMCHAGGRSRRVVDYLVGAGYDRVRNLAGGIDAWSQRIDPTVTRY